MPKGSNQKLKLSYHDVLQEIDYGWREEKNDPTPFIKYMLQVVLASYLEFEERIGVIDDTGVKSSSYDVVKAYVETKIGKFTPADVLANCPSVGRTSVFNALKKLNEEGFIDKHGEGKGSFYVQKRESIW